MHLLDVFAIEDKLWQVIDGYKEGTVPDPAVAKRRISGILDFAKLVVGRYRLTESIKKHVKGELVQLRVSGKSQIPLAADFHRIEEAFSPFTVESVKRLGADKYAVETVNVFYITFRLKGVGLLPSLLHVLDEEGFSVNTGSYGFPF